MKSSLENTLQVAVVMRQVPNTGVAARWQSHRWELASVTPVQAVDDAAVNAHSKTYAPLDVQLFKDDAQGYRLNVESPAPCWFVMWRMEEGDEFPDVQAVSLSYHDAGRWLDSQERVDQVPLLPHYPELVETLREFAHLHDTPDVKRRKRPDSFKTLTDRFGKPARVSHG